MDKRFNPLDFLGKTPGFASAGYKICVFNSGRRIQGKPEFIVPKKKLSVYTSLTRIFIEIQKWAWRNILRDFIRRHIIVVGKINPHLSKFYRSQIEITRCDLVEAKIYYVKSGKSHCLEIGKSMLDIFRSLLEDTQTIPISFELTTDLTLKIPHTSMHDREIEDNTEASTKMYVPD